MQPRRFFLDTQSRQFVGGFNQTFLASNPAFFQEDVESVELYFLEPTGDPNTPYRALNYGANTVKLAVGLTAPAALQTSWTSTSTTVTASITTLTNGGSGFNEVQRLTFSKVPTNGSYALSLPARQISFDSATVTHVLGLFNVPDHGLLDGQVVQVTEISLATSPSVTTYSNANLFVINRTKDSFGLAFTADGPRIGAAAPFIDEYTGSLSVSAITTAQIVSEATAADIQAAFVAAGMEVNAQPQIIVTGDRFGGFTFTFANTQANINFGALTVVGNTLSADPALQANVSFNTSEVAALIAAGNTQNLKMEVEVSSGAVRQTYSTSASISDDIITSASTSPVPIGTANSFSLSDGAGGVWTITVDPNGVLTTSKQ